MRESKEMDFSVLGTDFEIHIEYNWYPDGSSFPHIDVKERGSSNGGDICMYLEEVEPLIKALKKARRLLKKWGEK
jgi:hypothetical protein